MSLESKLQAIFDLLCVEEDRQSGAGTRAFRPLRADQKTARRFAAAARSDATLRAYRSDWADFTTWCDECGLSAEAGLDSTLYAGHSLRAGFAATAARSGKSDRSIQKQTRHRSTKTLAEYVREGRLFDDNASQGSGL